MRQGAPELLGLVEMIASEPTAMAGVRGHSLDASARLSFAHDEVYEAALALILGPERVALHLRAGRFLLARWRASGGSPFPAADHLHAALPQLPAGADRLALVELDLAAGGQAAEAQDFVAALYYFEAGIRLLDADAWQKTDGFAFALHLRAAEAARMCPDHVPSLDFITEGMARTDRVIERIALARVRILTHAARYEFDTALGLTLDALSWVGVTLPRGAHRGHVVLALLATTWRVRGKTLGGLRALPTNEDPKIAIAMQLLADTASITYYADPLLLPVLLCRMVDLSVAHGVCGPTAFGCAGWAFILSALRGDIQTAILWGAYARELIERFDDRKMAPKVELLVIGFVEACTHPLASLVARFERAGLAAREAGDAEYTALCAMNQCSFSFLGGVELTEVTKQGEAAVHVCREMRQEQALNTTLITLQTVECLRGEAKDPRVLTGTFMDAQAMNAHMKASGDKAGAAILLLFHVQLLLLFGDTASTIAAVEAATLRLDDLPGSPQVPAFRLHAALAWIRYTREAGAARGPAGALDKQHGPKALEVLDLEPGWPLTAPFQVEGGGPGVFDGPSHSTGRNCAKGPSIRARGSPSARIGRPLRQVRKHLANLRARAAHGAANFAHKVRLIEAELADAAGQVAEAQLLYEEAIQLARASGMLQEEAMCLEWASQAAARFGNHRLAADLAREARSAWQGWGAFARLQREVEPSASSSASSLAVTGNVEMASVVKAARAVSGQIQLPDLLRTLMRIILENAGATWGMLVLTAEEPMRVAATAAVEPSGEISVLLHDPGLGPSQVRPGVDALVREVARTRRQRGRPDALRASPRVGHPRRLSAARVPARSASSGRPTWYPCA